ncbi:MAG: T9SS type A sorting domain-containing protein, partial [Crocinitomicaceae bacterium]|nr:T9SS type A sorting domain-containing protein [Crocinitomicaceae bacterium]
TPTYTYAWTNGAPAVEDPTGLVGGTYDVTVTDSNGCTITDSYVVNSQVGIFELDQLQFNVFPNPSNGEFKLTLNSNVYFNIHVINSLGQVIYKDELSGSSKEIKLNSTQVGVYFVRLFNDELSTIRRIVIK